jgi:hypothetical protein
VLLLGCASPDCSGVEVPRPRAPGAAGAVGDPPAGPLLVGLPASPAIHPIRRPQRRAEEEEDAGRRTEERHGTHLYLFFSLTLSVRLSACVWLLAAGFGVNNGAQFETTIHDTVLSSLGCACKGAQVKTAVFTGHALRVRSSRRPLSAHALSMCVILHTATRTLPQKSCDECLTF